MTSYARSVPSPSSAASSGPAARRTSGPRSPGLRQPGWGRWCWSPRISPHTGVTHRSRAGSSSWSTALPTSPGLRRLRLYYLYPREIRPELIDTMTGLPTVVDYFDLSLQHVAPDLLQAMRRPGSGAGASRADRQHPQTSSRMRRCAPASSSDSPERRTTMSKTSSSSSRLPSSTGWACSHTRRRRAPRRRCCRVGWIPDVVMERLRYVQSVQDDITHSQNAAQIGRTRRGAGRSGRGGPGRWRGATGRRLRSTG